MTLNEELVSTNIVGIQQNIVGIYSKIDYIRKNKQSTHVIP